MAPSRTKQTARKSTGGRSAKRLNVDRNDDSKKFSSSSSRLSAAFFFISLGDTNIYVVSSTTAYEPPVPTTSTAAPKLEAEHPLVAALNMLENPTGPASYHFSPKTEYPDRPISSTPAPSIPGRNTQTARKSTGGRKPSRPQENTYSTLSHPVTPTPGSSSSTAQPFNTGAADPDTSHHGTSRRMKQTARKSTGGKRREHRPQVDE
ncbi:hypothetical protein ARMSODRAFT_1081502 [Armillaria solidipes]|uniref:Uncharacterized protein n=1 Tax=Armillaria solidipes TaxID=1076256 RepID=A0A2H3BQV7_9AGAR|nr:hypothetical protein ARMSODRAFT_1081502 [Armillaria solidipes]